MTAGIISELANTYPEVKVTEGGLKLVQHFVKERNPAIIKAKKGHALANGILSCEVCLFSFIGIHNAGYIECHHLDPISGGVRDTSVEDLALVCANCHRMLHTKFDGQYLNLSQLRNRMDELKPKKKTLASLKNSNWSRKADLQYL